MVGMLLCVFVSFIFNLFNVLLVLKFVLLLILNLLLPMSMVFVGLCTISLLFFDLLIPSFFDLIFSFVQFSVMC